LAETDRLLVIPSEVVEQAAYISADVHCFPHYFAKLADGLALVYGAQSVKIFWMLPRSSFVGTLWTLWTQAAPDSNHLQLAHFYLIPIAYLLARFWTNGDSHPRFSYTVTRSCVA